jgi:hypothetical protein
VDGVPHVGGEWQHTLLRLWTALHEQPRLQAARSHERELLSRRLHLPSSSLSTVAGSPRPMDTCTCTRAAVLPGLADALAAVNKIAAGRPTARVRVLVTGSLYLVGGMLARLL